MEASRARSARSDAVFVHPLAVAIDATRSALVKAGISFTTGWNRVRMLAEVRLEGKRRNGIVRRGEEGPALYDGGQCRR